MVNIKIQNCSRRFSLIVLAVLFLLSVSALSLTALIKTVYASESIPISTCLELQNINNNLSADYVLMNDIKCGSNAPDGNNTNTWNGGAGFMPIGNWDTPFTGSLWGNNKVITGLHINRPNSNNPVALFGVYYGGVTDLGLRDVDITGNTAVAGIIGSMEDGYISRSFSTGVVTGNDSAGGFVGLMYEGSINNSYSRGEVNIVMENANYGFPGGFAGGINGGVIAMSYTTAKVNPGLSTQYGGFGGAGGNPVASFWDKDIYGEAWEDFSDGRGTPKTTAELKDPTTYNADALGEDAWNFEDTWKIDESSELNDGYPYLAWEDEENASLQTFDAEDITTTSATLHGEVLLRGLTIDNIDDGLLVGFILNDDPAVNWDNNIHSAAVDDISEVDDNSRHLAFSGEVTDLECGTQYWYIAAAEISDSAPLADNTKTFTTDACPDEDNELKNTRTIISPVSGKSVKLELDEVCEIKDMSIKAESNNTIQDSGFDYPQGMINFTADCGSTNYTTTVKLYYYDIDASDFTLRKHNPHSNAYFTINGAVIDSGVSDDAKALVVTYQITDGGELDTDNSPNGTIVDPVGLATHAVGVPNTGLGRQNLAN